MPKKLELKKRQSDHQKIMFVLWTKVGLKSGENSKTLTSDMIYDTKPLDKKFWSN